MALVRVRGLTQACGPTFQVTAGQCRPLSFDRGGCPPHAQECPVRHDPEEP